MHIRSLSTFLQIKAAQCVSIMGAGGKATLMNRLADELTVLGHTVILSSTTNYHRPDYLHAEQILLTSVEPQWPEQLKIRAQQWNRLLVVHHDLGEGMVKGIDVAAIRKIQEQIPYAVIILKTDGARKRWFKAPNQSEPVIPPWSQVCITVVNVEIVGQPLTSKLVHRPERVQALTGLTSGDLVTPQAIATVLTHPQTYATKIPPGAKRVIYISHVQSEANREQASLIAHYLDYRTVDVVLAGDTLHGSFYVLHPSSV